MAARPVRGIDDEERDALDRAYRDHSDWLRDKARMRVGSPHAADDLVQEAFVRVARYPAEAKAARPLLLRILHNLIKDRWRSRSREAAGIASLGHLVDNAATAQPDQAEQIILRDILLQMPRPWREVFLLSRFTPLTQMEIAARLGLSVKTVEWRLARALEYCVEQLGE